MDLQQSIGKRKSLYYVLFITGIILVAFNLRPAITSVGPLVSMIQADLGMTHGMMGVLTSLPLVAFAVVSPIVPKLARKLHNEKALFVGLCIIAIGIFIRSTSSVFMLFTGTFLSGAGIAICNVLLPVIIKDKFPLKFGLMTSVYSTAMGLLASLASGLSVPLASGYDLGWKTALVVWSIPAVIAIIVWIYLVQKERGGQRVIEQERKTKDLEVWKSPLAWQVAMFMGFQSFLFYVTVAWLPEMLHHLGVSISEAGWLLSFTLLIGLPVGFIVPILAGRFQSQKSIVLVLGLAYIVGYSGLLWGASSSYVVMIISIILIGSGLGGTFPLGLAFLGLRSRNAKQAAQLSGMAQSIGYILAAVGPVFIGFLFDVTGVWTVPIFTLILISIVVIGFGLGAGRDRFI